jgi:hypothetical protein
MSILFGGIRQLGLVVRDAESAMRAWAAVGVGPFFSMRFRMDDYVYRGRPGPGPDVSLYFAHSGPLQLEIIQQHDDTPSAYTEFLAGGREGPQHVAAWYDSQETYDAKRRDLLDRRFVLVHEGASRAMGVRFAYFQTDLEGGLMFEISEALLPGIAEGISLMDKAAQDWDGKEMMASELSRDMAK